MRTTLEDLFYGNITSYDRQIAANSEMRRLVKRAADCESHLTKRLRREEQQTLHTLITAQHEINSITAMENFILGFRLGVWLMAECMDENDGALRDGGA